MPHRRAAADDWDDEDFESERAPDDDEPTIECPYCRREIYDDSLRCPHCENYLSKEDVPPARKPWWIILGVGLCLFAIYRWIVG